MKVLKNTIMRPLQNLFSRGSGDPSAAADGRFDPPFGKLRAALSASPKALEKIFCRGLIIFVSFLLLTSSAPNANALISEIQKAPGDFGDFASSGFKGSGFYLSMYEDVAGNPNKKAEEKLQDKYGINFGFEFSPPSESGPYVFFDFFQDKSSGSMYSPAFKDDLRTACIQMQAAQAEDQANTWKLVKKRLKLMEAPKSSAAPKEEKEDKEEEKKEEKSPKEILLDSELVKRLGKQIDEQVKADLSQAVTDTPDARFIEQRERLFECSNAFQSAFDFELKLQTMLNPIERQIEAMQTFVNGRLDDFDKSVLFTDITYGASFPRYDLITDLDIIDALLFGAPVQIGRKTSPSTIPDSDDPQDFTYYPNIEKNSIPLAQILPLSIPVQGGGTLAGPGPTSAFVGGGGGSGSGSSGAVGSTGASTGGTIGQGITSGTPELSASSSVRRSKSKGFGSSSNEYSGPYCPATGDGGLALDYALLGKPPKFVSPGAESALIVAKKKEEAEKVELQKDPESSGGPSGSALGGTSAGAGATAPGAVSAPFIPNGTQNGEAVSPQELKAQGESLSKPGSYDFSKNRRAFCEAGIGVDFGNEFFKLLFCVDVAFEKLGKSWEAVPDDNCLLCKVVSISQTFEEEVFKASIRPHKNTGQIMESGICKDGFSKKNIAFQFFFEWVPVKFYSDICYPQGGLTTTKAAELMGYPEIYVKVSKKGSKPYNCTTDLTEEKARKRCREAVGGEEVSYEQVKTAYHEALKKDITDLNDAEGNLWMKLVGAHGIAEGFLHRFQYLMGNPEVVPIFGEDDEADKESFVKQDLKEELEYLKTEMKKIREEKNEVEKSRRYLCLKGYFFGKEKEGGKKASLCESYGYQHTTKNVSEKITAERERVMNLLAIWNQMSADWNQENYCGMFAGSGLLDAIGISPTGGSLRLPPALTTEFYLDTEYRRTLEPVEMVPGQIVANKDLEDLDRIFTEIDAGASNLKNIKQQKKEDATLVLDVQKNISHLQAVGAEVQAFKDSLAALTKALAALEDEPVFASQNGDKYVSFLQSLKEKLGE